MRKAMKKSHILTAMVVLFSVDSVSVIEGSDTNRMARPTFAHNRNC